MQSHQLYVARMAGRLKASLLGPPCLQAVCVHGCSILCSFECCIDMWPASMDVLFPCGIQNKTAYAQHFTMQAPSRRVHTACSCALLSS